MALQPDCNDGSWIEDGHHSLLEVCTFTKSVRAKIIAASILISDALPFGRLWYGEPNAISNAIGYAKFYSRSHDAVIRVYDSSFPNHRSARAMQDGVLQLRLANRAEFIYDGAFDAERTFHRAALRLCHCGTNARAGSGRHSRRKTKSF